MAMPVKTRMRKAFWLPPSSLLENALKITNMVLCLHYVVSLVYVSIAIDNFYWRGGKQFRDEFNPDQRRPSVMLPVWYHIHDELPFGNWLDQMYIVFISICITWALVFINGIELLIGGRARECIIFVFLVLVTIVFEVILYLHVGNLDKFMNKEMTAAMLHALKRYYRLLASNEVTSLFNVMMVMGECCGVTGLEDFEDTHMGISLRENIQPYNEIEIYPDSPSWMTKFQIPSAIFNYSNIFKVPPACCKDQVFNDPVDTVQFKSIASCAETKPDPAIHNLKGCYEHYFVEFMESNNVMIVLCVVVGIQILQVVIVLALLLHITRRPLQVVKPVKEIEKRQSTAGNRSRRGSLYEEIIEEVEEQLTDVGTNVSSVK